MSTKSLVWIVVVVIVLVGGFFVFSGNLTHTSPSVVNRNNLQKVTIAEYGELFLYAPLYVAQEKGFFKDQGLDVNVVPTGGDEKTFAALLSGSAQFGVADPTFTAISGEKGQPGRVVASVVSGVPFWAVAKSNVQDISKAADLKNYSVATYPAPSTAYTLQKKMFQSANLKPNIKETVYGSLLAALDAKKVDIALELEPNASIAVKNGDKIVYSLAQYYPEFAMTGLTALPTFIDQNPETVQKVVNALQKAMDYIQSNPGDVAQLLNKKFPEVPQDVAVNAINNMITAKVYPVSTTLSQAAWDAAIQLRKDVGDLKADAPYNTYVVTKFSDNAK